MKLFIRVSLSRLKNVVVVDREILLLQMHVRIINNLFLCFFIRMY